VTIEWGIVGALVVAIGLVVWFVLVKPIREGKVDKDPEAPE
jgi:hypothetical protein